LSDHHPIEPADTRLDHAAAEGCEESRLLMSRRAMLGVSAGLFSWACVPRYAEAASASSDPRLLVVILRGGMDGLSAVVPHGDPNYLSARGDIAVPVSSTIKVNGFFGLHPALKNFAAFYKGGDAAVVHAAGIPLRTRSHFDGQDNLENGMPGKVTNGTGWLNRMLHVMPAGAPIKAKGAVEIGIAPVILRGPAPVLGWSPTRFPALDGAALDAVRSLYATRDPELLGALDRGLKADQLATSAGVDPETISVLRRGFRGAARLLTAAAGPRIAVLSVEGWDTHAEQGIVGGTLPGLLTELDLGLGDFKSVGSSVWGQTVVMVVTEFGRNVRINGCSGTDHGTGTVALLAGGAVNGGRVVSDWPGLAPSDLFDGRDLMPTIDLRSVFKGVLKDHLGVPGSILERSVFPSSLKALPLKNLIKTSTVAAAPASAYQDYATLRAESPIAQFRNRGRGPAAALA
jgi:uncharacterized protein (DUF1501 family)